MNPSISLENIWEDDDVIELRIIASNVGSNFTNTVYLGKGTTDKNINGIEKIKNELNGFKTRIHGGIYNLEIGAFGPEYANGAFQARFHYQGVHKIFISVSMESEFFDFGMKKIANRCELFLKTEPALLERFISELPLLAQHGNKVILECI